MEHKTTTNTTMFADGERFLNSRPAVRTILRSERGGNFPYSPTGTFSLDGEYCYKGVPCGVTDGFCETVIPEKPGDVQILDGNFIELSDDSISNLVEIVAPLVSNLLMNASKQPDTLVPILAPQLSPTDFSLCDSQSTLRHLKKVRILNYFSSRESSKVFNTNINTNALAGPWDEGTIGFIDQKDRIPSIGLTLDCDVSDPAFYGTRETQSNRAELRESELIAFKLEAALAIRERIVPILRFETWESWFLPFQASLKECIIGTTYAPKAFLKNARIIALNIRTLLANVFELEILRKEVNRLSTNSISITAFLKRSVVKLAAEIKHMLKFSNSVFRRSANLEFIYFQSLAVYDISGFSTRRLR